MYMHTCVHINTHICVCSLSFSLSLSLSLTHTHTHTHQGNCSAVSYMYQDVYAAMCGDAGAKNNEEKVSNVSNVSVCRNDTRMSQMSQCLKCLKVSVCGNDTGAHQRYWSTDFRQDLHVEKDADPPSI